MKYLLIGLIVSQLYAQEVQWAYNILEFSTQKGKREYSNAQVLGIPNATPAGKENINAWQTTGNQAEDYIKVGFLEPMKAKQIIIIETLNPGFITKVLAYDAKGTEHLVATYKPQKVASLSRILQINIAAIDYYIFAIKIVVNSKEPIAIDAIGMTTSDKVFAIKTTPNDIIKRNMVAKKLNINVNSGYPEMGPIVTSDGKMLYFSRRDDPSAMGGKRDEEDIYYAAWDDKINNWGPAVNMGEPLNNTDPNFINSISPDGNTILLGNSYLDDGSMANGVSLAHRTATGWSTPKRLIIQDDDRNVSKLANYFLSNSQKILLISNNRKKDSKGDRDLYVSFMQTDSTWSKPLNLGANVNTKGIEAAPFLAADDKTLYFTSSGWMGYGGTDIFMTKRLDDTWTSWTLPENLGPVVNTAFNESFLTVNASGSRVYFTSQANDSKDIDMYNLVLADILMPSPTLLMRGVVLNSKTKEPVPNAKIYFENITTLKDVGIATSSPLTGEYQITLASGNIYGYLAEKAGYVSIHGNLNLNNMTQYKEDNQNILLTPIEVGQEVILNNIFFDFGKYELRPSSYFELNRISKLLKDNPSLKIEIAANTDNIGKLEANDLLSINRAEAVASYLMIASNATEKQIVSKHYGETKPIATNETEKGRQLNRRVQFKILEK